MAFTTEDFLGTITDSGQGVCPVVLQEGTSRVTPVLAKSDAALLTLLGFGGFSVLIAFAHRALRKYVYKDLNSLDTVFDAGGRVSFSLTAVTVTSQFLWPSDFLVSSTLLSKSGIGGALWFALVTVFDMLIFPLLSLALKTRAPGAKTFPQIAYARFGKPAHILFCVVAVGTNLVVTSGLLLAGKTAIEVLTKDISNEYVMLVLAALFGSYCLIGGLGTTFYISYFNTALTYIAVSIFILKTTFYPSEETAKITSIDAMYEAMSCVQGPDGNFQNSFMTFRTRSGLIYGIVLLFMATSVSFTDQANWQSRIAAKPAQGVLGFILGAFLWFALPTAISMTVTMAYYAGSYQNGTHLLTPGDIENGYITPYMMETILGTTGAYLLTTMLMMALMSTGSGEVMSISSIIVYDIYKTYVNPFRKTDLPTCCVLCGKDKATGQCSCPSSMNCKGCSIDEEIRDKSGPGFGTMYTCKIHASYRRYEDLLMRYKSWCMVWIVILIVPYGLLIVESGMSLNWGVMAVQAFTSPFLVPIFLSITWTRVSGSGVMAGGITGVICGFSAMCVVGSTYEGGLSNFFVNTSTEYSLMAGLVAGLGVSAVVTVVTSLLTHKIRSQADADHEWAKTMSIDNPLNPYRGVYKEELDNINVGNKVTSADMSAIFKPARRVAYIGGSLSMCFFMVIIPAIALSFEILTKDQFRIWLRICHVWCFIGAVFVVLVPPIEEGIQIWKQVVKNRSKEAPVDNVNYDLVTDKSMDGIENILLDPTTQDLNTKF